MVISYIFGHMFGLYIATEYTNTVVFMDHEG